MNATGGCSSEGCSPSEFWRCGHDMHAISLCIVCVLIQVDGSVGKFGIEYATGGRGEQMCIKKK